MTDPTVCCVCLTKDRPAMLKRAIASFRSQAYANKRMYILDSGETPAVESLPDCYPEFGIMYHRTHPQGRTIGALRNYANEFAARDGCDIIAHADDDDYSAPQRLAEQVALLTASSGAAAVGYSDLLFWDTRKGGIRSTSGLRESEKHPGHVEFDAVVEREGQAWLYSRPTRLNVPGTTLCYWRKTWECKPFPHLPEIGNPTSQGEDIAWQAGLKVEAVSSVQASADYVSSNSIGAPRMIASVHSGNTMAAGYSHMGHVEEFRRVPLWDGHCRRVMEIK